MSDTASYKHVIPIQVRFNDVDRLNHVNNSCYLSYFELGRVKYFNHVFKGVINWDKSGFVLARTEIDHVIPIYLNDEVRCYTRVIEIGTKSLTIENTVTKSENGTETVCAKGIGILVAFDYVNRCSIELPELWRNLIKSHEGTSLT